MTEPAATAVIATRNRASILPRAIDSVLSQTLEAVELIVVDDGSTDGTGSVVAEYSDDARVRSIRHEHSRGLGAARNTGWRGARAPLVAFLDDDDIWHPDKLRLQVELAATLPEGCAVVYCGALAVTQEGRLIAEVEPVIRGDIRDAIVRRGLHTISSSQLFRREALAAVGGFDEHLMSNTDHDIWMALADHGYSADYVERPLVIAYQHAGERLTTDLRPRIRALKRYLEKWQPQIDAWFGERGPSYRKRYFAHVIATGAADALAAGAVSDAAAAMREVFRYSGRPLTSLSTLLRKSAGHLARKVLPAGAVRRLRHPGLRMEDRWAA